MKPTENCINPWCQTCLTNDGKYRLLQGGKIQPGDEYQDSKTGLWHPVGEGTYNRYVPVGLFQPNYRRHVS